MIGEVNSRTVARARVCFIRLFQNGNALGLLTMGEASYGSEAGSLDNYALHSRGYDPYSQLSKSHTLCERQAPINHKR